MDDKHNSWSKGEIVVTVVLSCLALGCLIPVLGLQATLAMKAGYLLAFMVASMLVGGFVVRVLGAFGVTVHGPRSAMGIQMMFGAGDIAVSLVVFTVPAFFIASYDMMAVLPSPLFFISILVAGLLAGTGIALLINALRLDAPERGEIWPEVRATVRAAQSFFTGWKNWVLVGLGTTVTMFHDGFTELLGFAKGWAGGQLFGDKGPWIGLSPSPAILALGYLAGPWTGLTLLATLVMGHWILMPIMGLVMEALTDPGSNWMPMFGDMNRSMGVGVLIGAAPGYLLWAIIRMFKKKNDDDAVPDRFPKRAAIVAIPLLLLALLVTAPILFLKGGLVSGLLGTTMVVILAPLGAMAMIRGLASVGIAPMMGLTMVSLLLASWVPRFSTGMEMTTLLLAIAAIVLVASGVASMHATSMRAASMLQFPRLPVAILVPVLVAVSSIVALTIVYAMADSSMGLGYGDMPMPYGYMFSTMAQRLLYDPPHGILFVVLGVVLGLALSCAKLPAMTVGMGLYLPPGLVFTLALGGLIRFIRAKKDDGQAGALSTGLIIGAVPIGLLVAASYLAETEITRIGYDALGEIVEKGWLGLPTFMLAVMLLIGVAIWARISNKPPDEDGKE